MVNKTKDWQTDPSLRKVMVDYLRTTCQRCGYEQNYKSTGLCRQCYVDRDSPSQEVLEERIYND